jgi:hypothetical protein
MPPEEMAPESESDYDLEVTVDGVALGMAAFVRGIVASVVVSLITALKGAENARTIEIRVRRRG